MSDCTNKGIGNKIHHFELGLLEGDERLEFEQHILECDYCLSELKRSKDLSRLIKTDPTLREIIDKESETIDSNRIVPINQNKKRFQYFSAFSIAAVIVLFLVLKDWQIDIKPSNEAQAKVDRMAIMYFNNLSDPTDSLKLGKIATNLLIADLSESSYLSIVSSQRLSEIVARIESDEIGESDKNAASLLADEADAKWLITGNVLKSSPNIIITTEWTDIESGKVLSSNKIEGSDDDDIFSVIDKLTIQIKMDLNLPSAAMNEPDPSIAEHTTNSPQAYLRYLKGVEYYDKYYFAEAQREFERALEIDSTIAMAYYYLAYIVNPDFIDKALKFSHRTSSLNQLYIKSFHATITNNGNENEGILREIVERYPYEKKALYFLGALMHGSGKYNKAIDYLLQALEIDPRMKNAYNLLAYSYNFSGDFEKSLWAIDKYIELAPDEVNPIDTKAEIYAFNGMLENSIESYRRALRIKPDFYASLKNLGLIYIFNQEYTKADSCLDAVISAKDTVYRNVAQRYKSYSLLVQGRFSEALEMLDKLILSGNDNSYHYHFIKSHIYTSLKDWSHALIEIERTIEIYSALRPEDKFAYEFYHIYILANIGNMKQAEMRCEEFAQYVEPGNQKESSYLYSVSAIAMAQNNHEKTVEALQKITAKGEGFFHAYIAGATFVRTGDFERAIAVLEPKANSFGTERGMYPIWSSMLYFYLGVAYDESEKPDKALEQYERFLGFWKNGDDNIKEIAIAKSRILKLKSGS